MNLLTSWVYCTKRETVCWLPPDHWPRWTKRLAYAWYKLRGSRRETFAPLVVAQWSAGELEEAEALEYCYADWSEQAFPLGTWWQHRRKIYEEAGELGRKLAAHRANPRHGHEIIEEAADLHISLAVLLRRWFGASLQRAAEEKFWVLRERLHERTHRDRTHRVR